MELNTHHIQPAAFGSELALSAYNDSNTYIRIEQISPGEFKRQFKARVRLRNLEAFGVKRQAQHDRYANNRNVCVVLCLH
jgi:hypothetical protein